jgi:hypothetical protein
MKRFPIKKPLNTKNKSTESGKNINKSLKNLGSSMVECLKITTITA